MKVLREYGPSLFCWAVLLVTLNAAQQVHGFAFAALATLIAVRVMSKADL